MHRLIVLVERQPGPQRVEMIRPESLLASAVVCGVRDLEVGGRRVIRVLNERQARPEVLIAADLIVRLRGLTPLLSEEEVAVLLDLLTL